MNRTREMSERTCKRGHDWFTNRTRRGDDCRLCAQKRALAQRERRGGLPRVIDPDNFPCGHDRLTEARANGRGCATCHREKQKLRYRAEPERHRKAALAYQKANRSDASRRVKEWRQRNPESYREQKVARRYAYDAETRAYLRIIRKDGCTYCGDSMQHVDHIDPVVSGGQHHWTNFAPACASCNSSKHSKRLLTWLLERAA